MRHSFLLLACYFCFCLIYSSFPTGSSRVLGNGTQLMTISQMYKLTPRLVLLSLAALWFCYWLLKRETEFSPTTQGEETSKIRLSTSRLEQIRRDYHKRLLTFPSPVFKDSKNFIDLGSPLKSVLTENVEKINSTKSAKLILLWTTFYGKVQWIPKILSCNRGRIRCDVSTNKDDLPKSDAIVMHAFNLNFGRLPQQRSPNQRWIYFSQEPPYISDKHFEKYNGLINWTSTYRWDSDFPAIYYNTSVLEEPLSETAFQNEISNIMKNKTKGVAIMNSNCKPQSNRFKLVEELRRHVPVDFYGGCGSLSCPKYTQKCKDTMSAYKFYLSFENSRCRDYITEKVSLPLKEWKAVPIVLGPHNDDYVKLMPPNSYIHTDGFSSMETLAEYIKLLDGDSQEYKKFHAWRRTHHPGVRHTTLCDMCEAVHNPSLPLQIYRDFKGWYEQDTCRTDD